MIDQDDLLDPGQNYTRSENTPFGARIPEYAFRQLVGYNLKLIRSNIDEPFGVIDDLFANLPEEEIRRIKSFFRDHPNLKAQVNWPSTDEALPIVCVINQGEAEDGKFTFLGDRLGVMRIKTPEGPVVMERVQRGVGMRCVTKVVVGTTDADLTMYLHHIVKIIFFVNKHQLTEFYDVHNLSISSRDLKLDTSKFPTFGFYKEIDLTYMTVFEWNDPADDSPVVKSVNFGLGLLVDALKDGEYQETPVPGEQG